MHRALLLPEIVTTIVRAGKTEPDLLYNCLFVNKLFSVEACRILWKGCYGIFGVGHVTPKISDLANMVLRQDIGPKRAQFYANFIRVLVFQENDTGEDDDTDDAQWHPQLRHLRFPVLEDLNIWKTKSSEELNTEENILHYVHTGLRDLRVDASGPLSDFFLDELSRLSPRLQQLDIDFKNVTITKEGLARFLQKMSHLEGIHVAALEKCWSAESFAAVARYERLKLLHVPATQDTWFDALGSDPKSNMFPALKYLYCLNTTGKALRRLNDINPRLEAIHVYNGSLEGAEDVLLTAARFPLLTNFRYQSGIGAHITGFNLLKLARGCRSLTSLSIGQDQAQPPSGIDITDSVVYSLAQSLPFLKESILLFEATNRPSIASVLIAFSQHCPTLNRLEISCGSDWSCINTLPDGGSFSNLSTMILRPLLHMEDCLDRAEFDQVFSHFQVHAAKWFPQLEVFTIDDADDYEQKLSDWIYDVSYKRIYGSEADTSDANNSWGDEDDNTERSESGLADRLAPLRLRDN
jgi:hypothetical protein